MEFFNHEAEQASLGSIIISDTALINTIEYLEPLDYQKKSHQIIYKTIKELFKNGTAIDLVTLTNELKNKDILDKIGGLSYIVHMINSVPTVENIEHYNNIIKTKSNQRKIYLIMNDVKKDKISIADGIQKINDIPQITQEEETLKEILFHALKRASKGTEHKFEIEVLNKYLGGVDKSEVITIGGYTSQGKSNYAIQLAMDFSAIGKKVLFLSGEMTNYEVGRRILANSNKKNIMDFRRNNFYNDEIDIMKQLSETMGDSWELNIRKIANIGDVDKYIKKYKPEIVFIDYLQNLGTDNDYNEITNNMRRIQNIALKEEITIFVLSQLSRNKEETRRPKLSDLRGSGRIEELSNIVMLMYWENRLKEKVKERKGGEDPEILEINIAKNRAGTIGRFELDFWPEYCMIKSPEYVRKNYND